MNMPWALEKTKRDESPKSPRLNPLLQISEARFYFGARKVAFIQGGFTLAVQSLVEGDSELEQPGIAGVLLNHGKERVLGFCELAGAFIMAHEHGLRAH